jgi:hypothetical protein
MASAIDMHAPEAPGSCPSCGKESPCPTLLQCAENRQAQAEGRPPREVVVVDVELGKVPGVMTKPCVCGATHLSIEPAMVAAAKRRGAYLPAPIPCPCGRLIFGCNFMVKGSPLTGPRPH